MTKGQKIGALLVQLFVCLVVMRALAGWIW